MVKDLKEVLLDDFWLMPATPKYINKGVPYITSKNIKNEKIDFSNVNYINIEDYERISKNRPILIDDILISMIGTLGEVAVVKKSDGVFYGQNMFLVRLNKDKIYQRYFINFFKSNIVKRQLMRNQNKSTQSYLKANHIESLKIPIPDMAEQKKIANKLDKVQEIIDIREKQIEQLDELIKSKFVEMFGNVKETIRLGNCCEVHARIGWQSLTKDEHMKNGEYMLITGTDFKDNEIDYSTCVYVSKERYEMDKNIILKNDDILITKDGTIGKVAIVHNLQKPATLNGGIFVVRPTEIFNKEYIAYVFKGPLFTEFVNKSKTGATIKHLNQKHLVEFEMPMPSVEKQIEFSKIYKQIDKQKFEIKKSLEETQKLQKSLMNKYFG